MKKFGFTLSELIVATSVVGIAAALIIPTVGRIIPDTNKIKILKYNSLLENATVKFYDSEYYVPTNNCNGLACFNQSGNIANFIDYLNVELNVEDGVGSDGVGINITNNNNNTYTVDIDTDLNNANNNLYSEQNTSPNFFRLNINSDGEIQAGDALTEAYLNNQYKMSDREQDLANASTIYKSKYKKT